MARLTPVDLGFLLIVVPVWLVAFALHTVNATTGRLTEPSVYVGYPEGPEGFPAVRSLRVGGAAESSGLQAGDELLRIGDNDLHGAGPLRFFAVAMQSMGTESRARVKFRRGNETYETWLEYTRLPLPIRFFVVSISFATMALLLLARAPRNPSASICFRALFMFSFGFLRAWGGPVMQTYCWYVLALCMSPFFAPLLILASRSFREVSGESLLAKVWPWLFVPVCTICASQALQRRSPRSSAPLRFRAPDPPVRWLLVINFWTRSNSAPGTMARCSPLKVSPPNFCMPT